MDEYAGRQYVGVDLHRRRSVIVRMTPEGERLSAMVRLDSDPFTLAQQVAAWGEARSRPGSDVRVVPGGGRVERA